MLVLERLCHHSERVKLMQYFINLQIGTLVTCLNQSTTWRVLDSLQLFLTTIRTIQIYASCGIASEKLLNSWLRFSWIRFLLRFHHLRPDTIMGFTFVCCSHWNPLPTLLASRDPLKLASFLFEESKIRWETTVRTEWPLSEKILESQLGLILVNPSSYTWKKIETLVVIKRQYEDFYCAIDILKLRLCD